MRMLFRNFFYAVGVTVLIFLYQADPNSIVLGDFARLTQSSRTQQLVLLITAVLVLLEFILSGSRKSGAASDMTGSSVVTKRA